MEKVPELWNFIQVYNNKGTSLFLKEILALGYKPTIPPWQQFLAVVHSST